jgi:hypothetical protein
VPKSWDEVSERADHIIQVCNDAEPQAIGEIPENYDAQARKSAKHGSTGRKTE